MVNMKILRFLLILGLQMDLENEHKFMGIKPALSFQKGRDLVSVLIPGRIWAKRPCFKPSHNYHVNACF